MARYQPHHKLQVGLIFNLHQYDGEVSGNPVGPQPGLPLGVVRNRLSMSLPQGRAKQNPSRQGLKISYFVGGQVKMAHPNLAAVPGQLKCSFHHQTSGKTTDDIEHIFSRISMP